MRKVCLLGLIILVVAVSAVAPVASYGGSQSTLHVKIATLALDDEYIVVQSGSSKNISGWMILSLGDDGSIDQLFRFPHLCYLSSSYTITVYSGAVSRNPANKNGDCFAPQTTNVDLYWDVSGNGPYVWRDMGDTACLIDNTGKLVDQFVAKQGQGRCKPQYP